MPQPTLFDNNKENNMPHNYDTCTIANCEKCWDINERFHDDDMADMAANFGHSTEDGPMDIVPGANDFNDSYDNEESNMPICKKKNCVEEAMEDSNYCDPHRCTHITNPETEARCKSSLNCNVPGHKKEPMQPSANIARLAGIASRNKTEEATALMEKLRNQKVFTVLFVTKWAPKDGVDRYEVLHKEVDIIVQGSNPRVTNIADAEAAISIASTKWTKKGWTHILAKDKDGKRFILGRQHMQTSLMNSRPNIITRKPTNTKEN